MLFANFINENNPECLYCHNKLIQNPSEKFKILKCDFCKEQFVIDKNNNLFGFSCKTLIGGINLTNEKIHICLNKQHQANIITVPYFYLNFFSKKDLYKKLKTYLTFS